VVNEEMFLSFMRMLNERIGFLEPNLLKGLREAKTPHHFCLV
jgi:hypothetical protein